MNLHYEFWVDYYEKMLRGTNIIDLHKGLLSHTWIEGKEEIPMQEHSICFEIGYPGLMIGLGYTHAVKIMNGLNLRNQIGTGFSLDYVTGLPYIPGSEVKGILRSVFVQNREYALEVFNSSTDRPQLTLKQLAKMEQECFGNRHPSDRSHMVERDTACGEDVFLDAWPIKPDQKGQLLGLENITSHRAGNREPENDGLTSPKPVTMLKVLPDVVLQFRFILKDTVLSDGTVITAEQRLSFYGDILSDLGVGAKTNTGFGVLNKADNEQGKRYLVKNTAGK